MEEFELKWMKLNLDIFENKKIKHILSLPDGERMVLFWFRLLVMASKCNDCGKIYLTEKTPYSEKMLSDQWGTKESLVHKALGVFKNLEMII